MSTVNLTKYAKILKKKLAYDEILKDVKPAAIKELKRQPGKKATISDVEFHLTTKKEISYSKELKDKIKVLREDEVKTGAATVLATQTLNAELPKAVKDKVLSSVTDYKKHFSL